MSTPYDVALLVMAAGITAPLAQLITTTTASLIPRRRTSHANPRPACAILVPAHDEAEVILDTLRALSSQLAPNDTVWVIADNCSDDTAALARAAGVNVVERRDADRRGKGYALAAGVQALSPSEPDVVVVLDADCRFEAGGLDALVRQAAATGAPAQAIYTLCAVQPASARDDLAVLGFLLKNEVRLSGLHRLGGPALLTGTGMAFPWSVIADAPLASGNIVEDMQLGIDLALRGDTPRLCPDARVVSALPPTQDAARTQRKRWIHGHMTTLATQVPRLMARGLAEGRLDLVQLACELAVPPLSLLYMLWTVGLAIALAGWLAGGTPVAAAVLMSAALAFSLSLAGAWFRFARVRVPLASLLRVPAYVLARAPVYLSFVSGRQTEWVRTSRGGQS